MRKALRVTFYFAIFSVPAFATGQVTSSGGTANSVPKYSSASAITDSAITDSGTTTTVAEPFVVNGGSVNSGSPSFSVTGYQQYGVGIQFKLSNLTGLPESGATSSILFTGGNRPNGFSLIQSGGTDYNGGDGFLGFQTTAGGVFTEVMRLSPSAYVGIGTTTPGSKLEVKGNIAITSGSGGALIFADGSRLTSATVLTAPTTLGTVTSGVWNATPLVAAYLPTDVVYSDTAQNLTGQKTFASKVGIGITSPTANLDIQSSTGSTTLNIQSNVAANGDGAASITTKSNDRTWALMNWNTGNGGVYPGSFAVVDGTSGLVRQLFDTAGDVYLGVKTGNGTIAGSSMAILSSGNIGIGTVTPTAPLEIDGNLKLTAGSTASIIFSDGTAQTTAFNPANCGADYAESVGVSGERTNYVPGDILVIDPAAPGKFLKSNQAYSTLVAGVYSTQPGFVGRLHPRDATTDATEIPMAMVGRVPTKVSAENGPIHVGDLLVSSSTLGYAMKGTDHSQMLGAVIGKALDSLDAGTGVIQVLVTLQ